MSDSQRFINPRTPGYKLVTVERRSEQIETLFDKEFSDVGGHSSFIPWLTTSEEDASSIECKMRVEVDGEETIFRVAEKPQLDGTGFATIRLEEYYE